jgi:hypothetical protein
MSKSIHSLPRLSSRVEFSSSSFYRRQRCFALPSTMSMTLGILVLLVCSSFVSCSPTPKTFVNVNGDATNEESNGFLLGDQNPLVVDAALPLSPVQLPLTVSSSDWYIQPRHHANEFLFSHLNANDRHAPHWLAKVHPSSRAFDDSFDSDRYGDYFSSSFDMNKRSTSANIQSTLHLKKRKQVSKPPMEVMNEIVNSIYLKR